MSKEQEELREAIKQAIDSSWEIDELQIHDNYDLDSNVATNQIMSILASRCWLKDDRRLNSILGIPEGFPFKITYQEVSDMQYRLLTDAGWQPVIEIEEVKE